MSSLIRLTEPQRDLSSGWVWHFRIIRRGPLVFYSTFLVLLRTPNIPADSDMCGLCSASPPLPVHDQISCGEESPCRSPSCPPPSSFYYYDFLYAHIPSPLHLHRPPSWFRHGTESTVTSGGLTYNRGDISRVPTTLCIAAGKAAPPPTPPPSPPPHPRP